MGVAHSIDVNGENVLFDNLLEEYVVPCEIVAKSSDVLARVARKLEELGQKPEELGNIQPLPSKATLTEMLADLEHKLSEIEERAKPFIEAISLSSNLSRKIDQVFRKWKIPKKRGRVKNTASSEKSPKEMLLVVEQKLSEIERNLEEVDKTATRCTSMLSRIEHLSKNLKVKAKEVPTQKVPFPPDERYLTFVEMKLSEIENSLTVRENKEAFTTELLTIKATIAHVVQQVPEAEAELIKKAIELRDLVDVAKQSIRSNPDFQALTFDLSSIREMAREIDELIKVESNMGSIATTAFFEAWVPKPQFEKVVQEIKSITHGKCVIEKAPPRDDDVMPTIIRPVPRFFEAFEKLTFSLGYPGPKEINPVLLMAVTFPFLFGIMFADVGQGAILLTVGFILLYFRGKVDINEVGDIMRYFIVSGGLFVLCGISAIIFGFLFGEFFGPSGVLHPILLAE
ncbi:MAG: hypothetical protein NWE80_05180, partial [Candidatus Bathyarchaeota archaeon]|nr:hypothetical protein [Candidatus Bathyarchaeota archaeon]